jgi:hypothetical protein
MSLLFLVALLFYPLLPTFFGQTLKQKPEREFQGSIQRIPTQFLTEDNART